MNHKHAAVLLYNGKPIIWGYNKIHGNDTFHAEYDVIYQYIITIKNKRLKSNAKHNFKNINIIVIRWGEQGFKNSKPCSDCCNYMKKIGINKIYYTINDKFIIVENISNIQNNHVCLSRTKGF
jgi:hypothetical protein